MDGSEFVVRYDNGSKRFRQVYLVKKYEFRHEGQSPLLNQLLHLGKFVDALIMLIKDYLLFNQEPLQNLFGRCEITIISILIRGMVI